MGEESEFEFQQRWVKAAEADLWSAKRKFRIWFCLFIMIGAACFITEEFLPRSRWSTVAALLLGIAFLITFAKAAWSASDAGDAKKFLRECRGDLTKEVQVIR